MQDTIFYVAAGETLGTVRDYANAKTVSPPTLVRGVAACLRMRLFARREGNTPYPMDALSGIVAWKWAMDSDFSEATSYKLEADNANIVLSEVEEEIDGEDCMFTQISIPIPDMNTEELAEWLGEEKSRNGLHGELVGYDGNGREVFILQVENFSVRNRITSIGAPTPVVPDYLTKSQVAALVAAGLECQFSADGEDWRTDQQDGDAWMRLRVRNSGGAWSDPFRLLAGPQGSPGHDSFLHVAYASDSSGTGFSLTPSNTLKYRAEIHSDAEIDTPAATMFAGKWVKYLGDDGTGVGDMLKSEYDTDGDGKVDEAAHADVAGSVAWEGVAGKPEDFTPSAHSHAMTDISDPVRQRTATVANPSALCLDRPVLVNSSAVSSSTLPIDFPSVKTSPDGEAYTGASGDVLTWEYHVKCTRDVTSVAVGSLNSSMTPIAIPATLPLIGGNTTWHVFSIRGIYRSGAVNNLNLQVSYCYSYEA